MIENFRSIRSDGRVIPENMSLEDMLSLGWPPAKVTKISWETNAKSIEFLAPIGILAVVAAGREFVAAIVEHEDIDKKDQLIILDSQGAMHMAISNKQIIAGHLEEGRFNWFELPTEFVSGGFCVIFELNRDNLMFKLDIDANNGRVVNIKAMR